MKAETVIVKNKITEDSTNVEQRFNLTDLSLVEMHVIMQALSYYNRSGYGRIGNIEEKKFTTLNMLSILKTCS